MPARSSEAGFQDRRYLHQDWSCCAVAPDSCTEPAALPGDLEWIAAGVPGTAAAALQAAGRWSLDGPERRFDSEDWWFRTEFNIDDVSVRSASALVFEGLATLCEVWLNDTRILVTDNMFVEHRVARPPLVAGRNTLHLRFRSLDEALKRKRPRPRWRTPMVENQQLRWHRTTLLGRTPGWSPPAAAVGPWRGIWLALDAPEIAQILQLHSGLRDGAGFVRLRLKNPGSLRGPGSWLLELREAGKAVASQVLRPADDGSLEAQLMLQQPKLWWPHTHGTPVLYEAVLCVRGYPTTDPDQLLGRIGFRELTVAGVATGGFEIRINDQAVFCRGACWTPLDVVTLRAGEQDYRRAIRQVVDAGFNMLRLSGTMLYEDELFHELCDEYGVLVWQEFMFASMDYPADDAAFSASVEAEAVQQLRRWASHPSMAVVCGNSEVSQQAAMWGVGREMWEPELFSRRLAQLATEHCPGAFYWPSSAHGGAMPHQPNSGTTSYYGLGAYLRGVDDLRRSQVKFATECLAFANIPDDETLHRLPGGAGIRVHHSAWKHRSPRDLGAGWDFDDVRDHYVRQFFLVDPVRVRYSDPSRYLALGREATAQAMTHAFSEWRRAGSSCSGALIWFLRDLWPGAGWGIIDSEGIPKSAYHALRRVLQPVSIGLTDEGLNGLALHLCNETPKPQPGALEVLLYREGQRLITQARQERVLPARSMQSLPVAELLPAFNDMTFAYRFGPLACDLVVARWSTSSASSNAPQAFYLPDAVRHLQPVPGMTFTAQARPLEGGAHVVTLATNTFLRGVCLQVAGCRCEDAHFWLAPGETRDVNVRPIGEPRPFFGSVTALNLAAPVAIRMSGTM